MLKQYRKGPASDVLKGCSFTLHTHSRRNISWRQTRTHLAYAAPHLWNFRHAWCQSAKSEDSHLDNLHHLAFQPRCANSSSSEPKNEGFLQHFSLWSSILLHLLFVYQGWKPATKPSWILRSAYQYRGGQGELAFGLRDLGPYQCSNLPDSKRLYQPVWAELSYATTVLSLLSLSPSSHWKRAVTWITSIQRLWSHRKTKQSFKFWPNRRWRSRFIDSLSGVEYYTRRRQLGRC